MLMLYMEAPFAACRTFTAGWYRPTATFLTPTAAYGLVLNVVRIESRLREEELGHPGKVPATLTRPSLPAVRLALGAPAFCLVRGRPVPVDDPFPQVQTVYQQLHNYPVGADAGIDPAQTRGSKYNITPVRREVLCRLRAVIALDGNDELERQVRLGLRGEAPGERYGLPFVGDNAYLPDRLGEIDDLQAEGWEAAQVHWYERVEPGAAEGPVPRTTRLTTWIDRADLARTTSALFAPGDAMPLLSQPPESAWTPINPPPVPPASPSRRRRNS
jgi:CRISPR-associated protein Cas5t